ncbi:hypothetical protein [Fulvivirga lutea]|uniref:Lipocalin-like domain-containing protein n=1 Tax=Fulvivirga lutea TaxID=2810512 RepID=A0A975A251_9BACT|nr:hypothetical protein [Fulvivirga lutea]QSE98172.1 hypothetical protein JR347_03580 [Fulvivirga lutea]
MKTLYYFLNATLLVSLLAFTGCSDDDDDGGSTPLEGTLWTETGSVETCEDPADNDTDVLTCTATECYTIRLANGTITFTDIEGGVTETSTGTYTINGNIITVTIVEDGVTTTLAVPYAISGNILTITVDERAFGGSCTSVTTYRAG